VSKANSIRKKALDFAKKREWDKALNEYIRLAEIESHNPNVFNELGDLHLKLSHKSEAFAAFHSAIDAYSKVSLFNNAVAVCKKIIRLNPNDYSVYGKLARLRNRQGFKSDAAKYAMNFLDLVSENASVNPDDLKGQVTEMSVEIDHSPEVLQRVADYLTKWEYKDEAAAVLDRLAKAYTSAGMEGKSQEAEDRVASPGSDLGSAAATGGEPAEVPPGGSPAAPPPETEIPVATVDAAGPPAGFENHRVDVDPEAARSGDEPVTTAPPVSPSAPPPQPDAPEAGVRHNAATQTATEELETPPAEPPPSPGPPPGPDVTEEIDARPVDPPPDPPTPADTPSAATPTGTPEAPADNPQGDAPAPDLADDEVWVPREELPEQLRKGSDEGPGEVVNVADIVSQFDAKVKADVDVEDYRSHYDLGMAYLEMDLLPEAIREFQFASNSSLYRVRCLEMIGLCFLKQNQPRLAIKQLEKGLDLVDEGDHESLGLQYNLGLAYEMTGDEEKARMCFEDVYVVDVAFRDVSEKVKRYSS
jgi:tetratricopeptide (TPR) repeat protein